MSRSSSSVCFSLLVASYNRPDLILETVRSLLGNSAPDVEVTVSDDASPKRAEVRGALAHLIRRGGLRFIQQEENIGWSKNRNALVDAARGEYVILLGDDDRLKPGAIDRLRRWTAKYPDVSIFGVGYDVIDECGKRVFTYCTPKSVLYEISCNDNWKEIFAYDAVPMWSHHPFTVCSKREVAATIRYNPAVDIADDALFLYDALEQGHKLVTIPEVLFEWRMAFDSGGDYATLSGSPERCHRARGLILAELLSRPAVRDEVKSLFGSSKFLSRFCMFREADAEDLLKLLETKSRDGRALGDFIYARAMSARLSIFRAVERHLRAIKVMGPGHIRNFLRFRRDKKRLAQTVRGKPTGRHPQGHSGQPHG